MIDTKNGQFENIPMRRTKRNPQYTSGLEQAAVQIMDRATLYPLDKKDLQRLLDTVNHPAALDKTSGSKMSPEEIIQWSQNWWRENEGYKPEEQFLWAIRNRTDKPETGELVGYVTAYTIGPALVSRLASSGLLENAESAAHTQLDHDSDPAIYEISYGKNLALEDKSEDLKGIVSSAVRQVTLSIGNMQQEVDITRFGNNPESVYPNVLILAFIDPDNPGSARIAENSGYIRIGDIKYHGNNKQESQVWAADWSKVSELLKTNQSQS